MIDTLTAPENRRMLLPGIWFAHIYARPPWALTFPIRKGEWEIIFCQSGQIELAVSGRQSVKINARQILIFSPLGSPWSMALDSADCIVLSIDPLAAAEVLRTVSSALGDLPVDLPAIAEHLLPRGGWGRSGGSPWNEAVFAALAQMPEENFGCFCLLKAVELLHLISVGVPVLDYAATGPYQNRYQRETIQNVFQYIEGHLQGDLRIQTLAELFQISPTMLKQTFRLLKGKTLHDAVVDCRMERAAALLADTSLTVAQIGEDVGYSSTSQFSTMFRRRFGVSPGQYRKNHYTRESRKD